MDSNDRAGQFVAGDEAVTIYDSNFNLVGWNEKYSELGITPKLDIKSGLHLSDTYAIAARAGVFGECDVDEEAESRFLQATNNNSQPIEVLFSPSKGPVLVKRYFLNNVGVVAVFEEAACSFKRLVGDFLDTRSQFKNTLADELNAVVLKISIAQMKGYKNISEIAINELKDLGRHRFSLPENCSLELERFVDVLKDGYHCLTKNNNRLVVRNRLGPCQLMYHPLHSIQTSCVCFFSVIRAQKMEP